MSLTILSVLDRSGDLTITWDPADPVSCERARAEVARLKSSGYAFFLVDGRPADEVTAGGGRLIVRRITADELIGQPAVDAGPVEMTAAPVPAGSKRRGRPPKAGKVTATPAMPDRQAIAVRPLAGG